MLAAISIHALREEGDAYGMTTPTSKDSFLSTPSARRATPAFCGLGSALVFLSTPSARRATAQVQVTDSKDKQTFLSTPSARRATVNSRIVYVLVSFLSTPSARRATCGHPVCQRQQSISIHALREEGDYYGQQAINDHPYFYPRPPRGGRPASGQIIQIFFLFLSTPSARRATFSF